MEFEGYTGGARDNGGSLTIETDAVTQARDQQDKARQAEKQKL